MITESDAALVAEVTRRALAGQLSPPAFRVLRALVSAEPGEPPEAGEVRLEGVGPDLDRTTKPGRKTVKAMVGRELVTVPASVFEEHAAPAVRRSPKGAKLCNVPGCTSLARRNGRCQRHGVG